MKPEPIDGSHRSLVSGSFGYLAKPFAERELHAVMQFALHRASLEAELDSQRNWLRAVINSIQDGVIATTPPAQAAATSTYPSAPGLITTGLGYVLTPA